MINSRARRKILCIALAGLCMPASSLGMDSSSTFSLPGTSGPSRRAPRTPNRLCRTAKALACVATGSLLIGISTMMTRDNPMIPIKDPGARLGLAMTGVVLSALCFTAASQIAEIYIC